MHPLGPESIDNTSDKDFSFKSRSDQDFSNLFQLEMLQIFKNVTNIIIETTAPGGFDSYSISLTALLSLIENTSLCQIIVKARIYLTRTIELDIYAPMGSRKFG
eukprot:375409_1